MSRKLQDTIEAFRKGRMDRREFFARGAAVGVSTATLGYMLNRSVSQALAADFDWKKHDGTAIKLLLNKHPYTDAMIANLDNFKEMTGMDVTYDIFPEDVYFDKVGAALSAGSSEYDAFMTGAYQTWTYGPAGWLMDMNEFINDGELTNPHYNWERMQQDDFRWWRDRVKTQIELFDLVRVDHFRGFEAFWEIGGAAETAMHGHWVKVPGAELFDSLQQVFRPLPLVAEDLGIITPEVTALRERFNIPGMKVLQFAFDGGADNPYLPHNHEANSVVYSGTHDNNTARGWFSSEISEHEASNVRQYLNKDVNSDTISWDLMRLAWQSPSKLCIAPMQDLLSLDGAARMNTPGVGEGCWTWRCPYLSVSEELEGQLLQLTTDSNRAASRRETSS